MHKNVKWLLAELPCLVEKGVLSDYYAAALRDHYASAADERLVSPLLVICGILGALLIGGGIALFLILACL